MYYCCATAPGALPLGSATRQGTSPGFEADGFAAPPEDCWLYLLVQSSHRDGPRTDGPGPVWSFLQVPVAVTLC